MKWLWWILLAWWLAVLAGCGGCATTKAVDSTEAVRALTAGESQVTYQMIPGDLMPGGAAGALAGKVIAIPTVPGKDVECDIFYADGTPFIKLRTKRSAVTDAILGKIAGIDAEKFAADAAMREFYAAQLDKMITLVQPFLNAQLANMQAPSTSMSQVQRFQVWRDVLTDPNALAQLKAALGIATSQPAP